MYYHIIVETTDKTKKGDYERCYELDCTNLEDIVNLVARPYSNNDQIYVNGRYIDRDKIRQLKIKSSEKPIEELRNIAQSTVSRGVLAIYTAITVVNGDKYVTDAYFGAFRPPISGLYDR